jgi:hypothetical protein
MATACPAKMTASMAAAPTMAVTMTVPLDMNYTIRDAQNIGLRNRDRGCGQGRSERKSAGCETHNKYAFHLSPSSSRIALCESEKEVLAMFWKLHAHC